MRSRSLGQRTSSPAAGGARLNGPFGHGGLQFALRLLTYLLAACLLMPTVAILVAMEIVEGTTRGRIFDEPQEVPEAPVAIIFGAGLTPNGLPSPALARRVEAGVALYEAGRVHRLLMSGDSGTDWHDEVGAMRDLAIATGVPADAILIDPAGFRTYESCERARAVYGFQRAVVVTQAFHLPRTIFTCDRLGVDAVGFVAERFTGPAYTSAMLRERVAQVFSVVELALGERLRTGP